MPTLAEVSRAVAPLLRDLLEHDRAKQAAATQSAPEVTATSARRQVTSGRNAKDAAA